MQSIETSIIIDAPPAQVWQVLMNFDRYPQWNPFVKSIKGEAKMGAHLECTLQPEGMKPQVFKPTVVALELEREFAWLGKLGISGLFDGEHHFQLIPQDDKTLFIHKENFNGILVPLLLALIGDKTRRGFEAMNRALKQRVENIH